MPSIDDAALLGHYFARARSGGLHASPTRQSARRRGSASVTVSQQTLCLAALKRQFSQRLAGPREYAAPASRHAPQSVSLTLIDYHPPIPDASMMGFAAFEFSVVATLNFAASVTASRAHAAHDDFR